MVGHRQLLDNQQPITPRSIVLGDGRSVTSEIMGNALIISERKNGKTVTVELNNVLYVPMLDTNLLSCAEMDKRGHEITFKKGWCFLKPAKQSMMFNLGSLHSGVYKLDGIISLQKHISQVAEVAAVTKKDNVKSKKVWHNRLGHVGMSTITSMMAKGSVRGMEAANNEGCIKRCEWCLDEKQTRDSLKSRSQVATSPAEVIHSDVCGPMPVKTLAGRKYLVTFVDAFSGYKGVYLMESKSEVLEMFKRFCALFERKFSCTIKTLYSDNGGEYEGLQTYLTELGIDVQRSAPYSPEQNGVAERTNRTVMDMARSMLSHAGLPAQFWGEAVVTATDICNHIGRRQSGMKTPLELLTGKRPYVGHFRAFGCRVRAHVPKQLRTKLQKRSRDAILLRCLPHSVLRVWDSDSNAVQQIRHAIVIEEEFPARNWKPARYEGDAPKISSTLSNDELTSSLSPSQDFATADELWDCTRADSCEEEGSRDDEIRSSDTDVEVEEETSGLSDVSIADLTYTPGTARNDNGEHNNVVDRYPSRVRRSPERLAYIANCNTSTSMALSDEPSLEEALIRPNAMQWKTAIQTELDCLAAKETWIEVKRSEALSKPLDTKMVLRIKRNADGSVEKHKARLVVKGFQQHKSEGLYAPVVDFSAIRLTCAMTWRLGGEVHQMDVSSAFLNGELPDKDPIYIEPPNYLGLQFDNKYVLRLQKALYGLKNAPRAWNRKWNELVTSLGFQQLKTDECVYRMSDGANDIWLLTYVDDILVMGKDASAIQTRKERLQTLCQMTDLGRVRYFLKVEFNNHENNVVLSQEKYANETLRRFNMQDCRSVITPMSPGQDWSSGVNEPVLDVPYKEAIGALLFLSTRIRPDISFAVSVLSRFSSSPRVVHWVGIKRIFRYLKGTLHFGIRYDKGKKMNDGNAADCLHASSDADWAGSSTDRKSVSGATVFMGRSLVSWRTKKQKSVALSTSEAEYILLSECAREVKWMRELIEELGGKFQAPTCIEEDNSGAIAWSQAEKRAKHVDIRYHYTRALIDDMIIRVVYCPTNQMSSDIMTKAMPGGKFIAMRDLLQLHK